MPYTIVRIAEFDLGSEIKDWLKKNTNAVNEEESSDYVLGLSRTELETIGTELDKEEQELLENTPGAYEECVPDEVMKFIEEVKSLPDDVWEIRVR